MKCKHCGEFYDSSLAHSHKCSPNGEDTWVSVTDRLPTELHVLVCDANTQWVGDYWRLHAAAPFPSDITHWRPLPATPNTREGEAP